MSLLLCDNDDRGVWGYVNNISTFVRNDNVDALERYLKINISIESSPNVEGCINAVKESCEHLMIYAAMKGQREVVEVFIDATLRGGKFYKRLSDDYIDAAESILAECSTLRM